MSGEGGVASSGAPRPQSFPVVGGSPGPRCGHTLTALMGPNGDVEGTRLILFGGATALEGAASRDSNSSGAGIRLAGATADVHSFDVKTGTWIKLNPTGEAPSPRAAHAAAAVGSMVVIQGGIGPAGLATDDLHVLDFTDPENPRWHRVLVQGPGPGARYAHTLSLVAQHFLLAVGGNDGREPLADAWALDTSEKPYHWRKIEPEGDCPPARMYATAAARGDGLLLLCGGRASNSQPLGDAYGLARHRDGRWEWAAAPGVAPSARYQHAAVFVEARLHVSGGALGGGRMVDDSAAITVLDTAAGVWCGAEALKDATDGDPSRRCRHAVAAVGKFVFMYGGLRGGVLLDDMLVADDSGGAPGEMVGDPRASSWRTWLDNRRANQVEEGATSVLVKAAEEEAAAAAAIPVAPKDAPKAAAPASRPPRAPKPHDPPVTPDVRLHHRAVVVAQEMGGALGGLVRQLSIDQFQNEARRVSGGKFDLSAGAGAPPQTPAASLPPPGPRLDRLNSTQGVHKLVLNSLLHPREWIPPETRDFFLDVKDIGELCDHAERVLMEEDTVLNLRAPVKIFGDLHGQFGDLMRLFNEYGSPSMAGDITYIDYLFLGDYVDRGAHSLETVCLLLALKIEHPHNIHLIRGNHEAAEINALFGFRMECLERLGEDGIWCWQRINNLFNWLPLAATIENKILCMHGGIGRSINFISQIEALQRPITMEEGDQVLRDLLWSDPTINDGVEGVQPSPRGPGLVTFGPDRVKEFCAKNNLQKIVRAHECVMDGFERFAQGHLITLFSATNYCGTANNAGAILVLGRDLVMVPKLIHPLPPTTAANRRAAMDAQGLLAENDPPTPTMSGSGGGGEGFGSDG
eukprot:CAMPEP_0182865234 /NCGR_PEP_ID=MMETSP0034_2-20130328/7583_1 /TAXON_ID=156128 /ORGANISM="Nephroselmis pyriformis, Strain CCMP717" /LENGTH=859 /DNA_ID=CAMNT_0024997525 /DNA_START=139 /DNA_END=2715 /DNA_ORIENTATION=-